MLKNLPVHRRPGFNPWVGKIPWRRAWQLTPVFLPGESQGQRNLAGSMGSCGHKESDMTEQQTFSLLFVIYLFFLKDQFSSRKETVQCSPR